MTKIRVHLTGGRTVDLEPGARVHILCNNGIGVDGNLVLPVERVNSDMILRAKGRIVGVERVEVTEVVE